ncbi:MAG: pitrilysin family protein [Candidatus Sumerlaeota bacterium]|nr:pitrilysin family protein [Candidatus Sumerlaeota bacterium]
MKNGIRLLVEPVAGVRSVAVGVWAVAGSRFESACESGTAHFLEHIFFKGTPRRTPYEIAFESNRLGSQVNAFTSQEIICLHAHVIDEKLPDAADLLCDLMANSLMDAEELERERNVILEEVMMYEDTPDERVNDLFAETLWNGHALGRPVLGKAETLRALNTQSLRDYWARWFRPERMLVSVAGATPSALRLKRLFEEKLPALGKTSGAGKKDRAGKRDVAGRKDVAGKKARAGARCDVHAGVSALSYAPADAPQSSFHTHYVEKPLEQTHFCFGVGGPHRDSNDRYAMAAMNLILGGGMSSRLFQEVREKRGLAYTIGSYANGFLDAGYFAITGGTTPDNLEELLDICFRETRRICTEDISRRELQNAKDMMLASLLLSLESMNFRMMRLAENEIYHGREIPIEETLAQIEKLRTGDVRACAERYLLDQRVAAAYIGPRKAKKHTQGRNVF